MHHHHRSSIIPPCVHNSLEQTIHNFAATKYQHVYFNLTGETGEKVREMWVHKNSFSFSRTRLLYSYAHTVVSSEERN